MMDLWLLVFALCLCFAQAFSLKFISNCRICDGFQICGRQVYDMSFCANGVPCTQQQQHLCSKLSDTTEIDHCDRAGVFPDPYSRRKYFKCNLNIAKQRFEKTNYLCPPMKSFSLSTARCLNEEEQSMVEAAEKLVVYQKPDECEFRCPGFGMFADPCDCKKFYECDWKLHCRDFYCPFGTYFNGMTCSDVMTLRCGKYLKQQFREQIKRGMAVYSQIQSLLRKKKNVGGVKVVKKTFRISKDVEITAYGFGENKNSLVFTSINNSTSDIETIIENVLAESANGILNNVLLANSLKNQTGAIVYNETFVVSQSGKKVCENPFEFNQVGTLKDKISLYRVNLIIVTRQKCKPSSPKEVTPQDGNVHQTSTSATGLDSSTLHPLMNITLANGVHISTSNFTEKPVASTEKTISIVNNISTSSFTEKPLKPVTSAKETISNVGFTSNSSLTEKPFKPVTSTEKTVLDVENIENSNAGNSEIEPSLNPTEASTSNQIVSQNISSTTNPSLNSSTCSTNVVTESSTAESFKPITNTSSSPNSDKSPSKVSLDSSSLGETNYSTNTEKTDLETTAFSESIFSSSLSQQPSKALSSSTTTALPSEQTNDVPSNPKESAVSLLTSDSPPITQQINMVSPSVELTTLPDVGASQQLSNEADISAQSRISSSNIEIANKTTFKVDSSDGSPLDRALFNSNKISKSNVSHESYTLPNAYDITTRSSNPDRHQPGRTISFAIKTKNEPKPTSEDLITFVNATSTKFSSDITSISNKTVSLSKRKPKVKKFQCPSVGLFRDPNNCHNYYKCKRTVIRNKDCPTCRSRTWKLTSTRYTCENGRWFSKYFKTCVEAKPLGC